MAAIENSSLGRGRRTAEGAVPRSSENHAEAVPASSSAGLAGSTAAYGRAKRAMWLVIGPVLILLATHLGEFWPFSIYPMFSRAGRPFTRSVVRELEPNEPLAATQYELAGLPGKPFPLVPVGIAQNDVACFVSKTVEWTPELKANMQQLFAEHTQKKRLVVFAADGHFGEAGGVDVHYRPVIELSAAGARKLAPVVEGAAAPLGVDTARHALRGRPNGTVVEADATIEAVLEGAAQAAISDVQE